MVHTPWAGTLQACCQVAETCWTNFEENWLQNLETRVTGSGTNGKQSYRRPMSSMDGSASSRGWRKHFIMFVVHGRRSLVREELSVDGSHATETTLLIPTFLCWVFHLIKYSQTSEWWLTCYEYTRMIKSIETNWRTSYTELPSYGVWKSVVAVISGERTTRLSRNKLLGLELQWTLTNLFI